MKFSFNHNNFNVLDLKKSIAFYEEALGLKVTGEYKAPDGSFILAYLGDGATKHRLELTWLRDRKEPYNLGDKGLEAFQGVVLLASHDHELLTSTCNRVIAFQPDGTIIDKMGNYDDYLAWMAERKAAQQ